MHGRVALITGASRGIGAAIAKRFASEGAKVVLVARTLRETEKISGSLEATASAIQEQGGTALPLAANLARIGEAERIADLVLGEFGRLDILVNNAAWLRFGASMEQQDKDAELALKLNFHAPFALSRAFVPQMKERKEGWIVNISSGASRHPCPAPFRDDDRYVRFHQDIGPTLYGASKAALERLSSGMAAELAPHNIAVNALSPVEAVASEGAVELADLGGDTHVEPVEAMAEAALLLSTVPPSEVSGRLAVSLELLAEFGVLVRSLDGSDLST